MSDRGVSEVLGFVLVFALVTGTIGIVFATGFSGLERSQHEEQVQNVERAFEVLADNTDDLAHSMSPSRATEITLAGGSLSLGEPVRVSIYAENTADSSDNASYSASIEPIVYADGEGTTVVYSSGAVIRAESGGAVMLREPSWIIDDERSVLPLLNTGGSNGGIGGGGTVLVVTERDARSLGTPIDGGAGGEVNVTVTVNSTRAAAWGRHFESAGFSALDADPSDGEVEYRFQTETVYVPRNTVRVSFEQ